MTTERLLQVCIAVMAALATLMLGTSQDNIVLPIAVVSAAISSLIFTDMLGWFQLHRYVAGAAGVVAALHALMQSQNAGLEVQFISVANLLIHLQIILLFQKKTERIYWQLITLSLLQVVVAAALNLFFMFGPLLVVYTAVAISAMLLFFIHRQTAPYIHSSASASLDPEHGVRIKSLGIADIGPSRSHYRPRRELLRASFLRYFSLLSASTVIVSACVFLLMPRFGDGVWQAKAAAAKTGFSGEVNLEETGSIFESPALVMRVSFTEEATAAPYTINVEPYFRGGVLRKYEGRGRWTRGLGSLDTELMNRLPRAKRITSVVRQTMSFERQRGGVVFSLTPACSLDVTPRSMRIDPETNEILYEPGANDDPTQYSLGTFGLRNGMQSQYSPQLDRTFDYERAADRERRQFPELAAAAAEIVNTVPLDDVVGRARALEAHFTGGGRYQYSLDPSPNRDPNVDPVVDFALNHKTGHCQYFASALALMLRSQGIPARVVVGYRGGIFNLVGNYYQLREMDAHAWVEAAIPATQVPTDEILPTEGIAGDAWMRLDPTPSGDWISHSVRVSPWRQKLSDTIDYLQLLWSEYVLGLNEKRQRKAIYEPIRDALRNFGALIWSREIWASRWQNLLDRFQGRLSTRANARDSVIAVAVLTIAFYGLRFLIRLVWQLGLRYWTQGRSPHQPRVEFYRRLEGLLDKIGVRRSPQQTHFEFACDAREHIARVTGDTALAEIPGKIVNAFYRVRFGKDRLDSADSERLENWLETLQKALTKSQN